MLYKERFLSLSVCLSLQEMSVPPPLVATRKQNLQLQANLDVYVVLLNFGLGKSMESEDGNVPYATILYLSECDAHSKALRAMIMTTASVEDALYTVDTMSSFLVRSTRRAVGQSKGMLAVQEGALSVLDAALASTGFYGSPTSPTSVSPSLARTRLARFPIVQVLLALLVARRNKWSMDITDDRFDAMLVVNLRIWSQLVERTADACGSDGVAVIVETLWDLLSHLCPGNGRVCPRKQNALELTLYLLQCIHHLSSVDKKPLSPVVPFRSLCRVTQQTQLTRGAEPPSLASSRAATRLCVLWSMCLADDRCTDVTAGRGILDTAKTLTPWLVHAVSMMTTRPAAAAAWSRLLFLTLQWTHKLISVCPALPHGTLAMTSHLGFVRQVLEMGATHRPHDDDDDSSSSRRLQLTHLIRLLLPVLGSRLLFECDWSFLVPFAPFRLILATLVAADSRVLVDLFHSSLMCHLTMHHHNHREEASDPLDALIIRWLASTKGVWESDPTSCPLTKDHSASRGQVVALLWQPGGLTSTATHTYVSLHHLLGHVLASTDEQWTAFLLGVVHQIMEHRASCRPLGRQGTTLDAFNLSCGSSHWWRRLSSVALRRLLWSFYSIDAHPIT